MVLSFEDHVVVVGGGLAGWRCIEALRRDGFEGDITLIGDEHYAPYDRPPLSKHVLAGKWKPEKTILATPERVEETGATLRLGVAAVGLDVANATVHLADGSSVAGTFVVIATGSRARLLNYSAGRSLHAIHSRDDLESLEVALGRLGEGSLVAVVGGGFIGAEVATALHTRGFVPIILEVAQRPLIGVLGEDVSLWLEGLAGQAGIELRTSQRISDVRESDENFVVSLENDEDLVARIVIVGAGAIANDEWLATSGLEIDNGVVVDENLLATSRVAAIGDVARFAWKSAAGIEHVRIEHWQVANDHAKHLAHFLMTGETWAAPMIPYFWSDQYAKKIQVLGHPRASDQVELVNGSIEDRRWLALYSRDDIVTGVVALSQPRALMLSKVLLEQRTSLEGALAEAPWSR